MKSITLLKTTEKRYDILKKMGIHTLEDILSYYPYRYDYIEETYPTEEDDKFIVEVNIVSPLKVFFKGRMSRMSFSVEDRFQRIYQVTIFNRHFLKQYLTLGKTITIIGKCQGDKVTATDIKIKPLCEVQGIHPLYSLKDGISQKSFQQYVQKAFLLLKDEIEVFIPQEYVEKHQLIQKVEALWNIHCPQSQDDIKCALKYLKYEEFLKFQLTMQLIKQQRLLEVGQAKVFKYEKLQTFIQSLPYQLTSDQELSVKEIIRDLQSQKMMYRFLQGDVGSGKTVVSSIALYANYLAGYQGALMAPTEILAAQHYQTLLRFFANTPVRIGLLTGSLRPKEKSQLTMDIYNGDIDIIVGTHALFQKKVVYHQLGFVITDEQHRFGVEQRKSLKNKGNQVDFLVMSATPIPRTLAISMYGDMDVSTIKTMPQGRIPTTTKYIQSSSMKPILEQLKAYLDGGGQCYVVCPLVEDSEHLVAKSAFQIAEAMTKYFEGVYRVGLLHGQLADQEKAEVMAAFQKCHIQILVSTTVIEVGVDVKNANMMIIYNAERFGMSQLHQLRGRVGRGNQNSFCFLMSASTSQEAIARLKYMEKSHDGFDISMYDLQIRGPGEVLGQRQSGMPTFLLADVFKDFPILEVARADAIEMMTLYENKKDYRHLFTYVQEKLKENNEYVD